jgi:hypothetical protein
MSWASNSLAAIRSGLPQVENTTNIYWQIWIFVARIWPLQGGSLTFRVELARESVGSCVFVVWSLKSSLTTKLLMFSADPDAFQIHLEDHKYSTNIWHYKNCYSNRTATAIHKYKYSLFGNGYSWIFIIFATRGILYPGLTSLRSFILSAQVTQYHLLDSRFGIRTVKKLERAY